MSFTWRNKGSNKDEEKSNPTSSQVGIHINTTSEVITDEIKETVEEVSVMT
jgi:hypothetical protein